MSNVDSIKVRMYNTGSVGDCLLLLFQKNNQTSFSMLIDCGGFNTTAAAITACAEDIRKTINNQAIDLVVVTHEHLDHVSGFNQARSVFDQITFKQLWMAWTEDDADPLARKLKRELGKKITALTSALEGQQQELKKKLNRVTEARGLKKRLSYYSGKWSQVLDALHFEAGKGFSKSAASSFTVPQAMQYVKSKPDKKQRHFRKPGEVVADMKGAEGVKFYILGPPYDQDLSGIRDTLEESEMYSLTKHLAFAGKESFMSAIDKTGSAGATQSSPFGKKYRMDEKTEEQFSKMYNHADMSWRQIEEDWMDASDELAIAVNSYTNNTSLAMAIEFESSGKVLLFPADAQSGNWMSWHNPKVMQDLKKNGGNNTDELLSKTVFYKVGHHGSHNGTASKDGLDKMTSKGLVAMMPLVQNKVPVQWGGSKNFPAKALYAKLIEKTNGAVIRTDDGLINDGNAKSLREKNLPDAMKKKLDKVSANPLYKEWTVEA